MEISKTKNELLSDVRLSSPKSVTSLFVERVLFNMDLIVL